MAKTIICPACGNRGDSSDDIHFEVRGQHHGRPVRKCLRCGTGLYVKMLGRPQAIPHDTWVRMREIWQAEFGPDDNQTGAPLVGLDEAADAVIESVPDDAPLAVGLVFIASVVAMRSAFPPAARGHADLGIVGAADWTGLDDAALRSVLRVAIGPSLLLFLSDDENRAFVSEALDARPSETVATAWKIYLDQILTPDEAASLANLPEIWAAGDSFKFSSAVARALRAAAGFDDGLGATEVLIFGQLFTSMAETVDDLYWSMLQSCSESA